MPKLTTQASSHYIRCCLTCLQASRWAKRILHINPLPNLSGTGNSYSTFSIWGDTMSKTNTPFFIAGALATLTLLASGVFAIAPYIAFLSPIAALGVPLPVILTLFVLSAVVIAISCKVISQNKKLDAKEAEVNEKKWIS